MDQIKYSFKKGGRKIHPKHSMVKNWEFDDDNEEEAVLANSLAYVAEKTGLSRNQLQYIFPAILRMMKSKSQWAE